MALDFTAKTLWNMDEARMRVLKKNPQLSDQFIIH